MLINLFDNAFDHLSTDNGCYSTTMNRKPIKIRYVRRYPKFDGITLFTDAFLFTDIPYIIESKYKIGWLLEPIEINPRPYLEFESIKNKFDFCLTYDESLLKKYPTKTKLYLPYGSWILEQNQKIYKKNKNICMIYSNKRFASGHSLRHEIANKIKNIDLYGTGASKPFLLKDTILAPYKFSIVIENVKTKYGFSEKLMDCFATGTVPIYWGCTNIEEYFDIKSILTFNTIDELEIILSKIQNKDIKYENMIPSIINNFNTFKQINSMEDWMYENIFKNLEI